METFAQFMEIGFFGAIVVFACAITWASRR